MTQRDKKGQFKPGHSGNPKGRPSSSSQDIRDCLSKESHKVAEVIIKEALKGKPWACKLVFERLCPPLKAQASTVKFALPNQDNPIEMAKNLLNSIASGTLPPDIGSQLVAAVTQLVRITDTQQKLLNDEEDIPIDKIQIQLVDSNGKYVESFDEL